MNFALIKDTIVKLCGVPRNFGYLSRHSSGLDPIVLRDILGEMVEKKDLRYNNGHWVAKHHRFGAAVTSEKTKSATKALNIESLIPFYSIFKKPHPLDYEWRNSATTLAFLNDLISSNSQKSDNILLLGMPSLFLSAFYKKMPQKFTLIDRNQALLSDIKKVTRNSKRFKIIQEDIFTINLEGSGSYDAVFIDPPWYSNHYFHFMWASARCLRIGGYLAVSFPPLNTRPGLEKEKVEWIKFCEKQGLYLERIDSNRLEYVMPFFEFNALRSAGIQDIEPFWRLGDLAVFRKVSHIESKRPDDERKPDVWEEIDINGVRIRVNNHIVTPADAPLIAHLVNGDILPTVSSRDSRRSEANLWTSGNRIFRIKRPADFIKFAKVYKKKGQNSSKDFKIVAELLDYIIDIETKEYQNYIDWIQYEMEGPYVTEPRT